MGSIWGRITRCNRCDFSFSSNHSHAVDEALAPARGVFFVVCVCCLQDFALPTKGPWGPAEGEALELHRRVAVARGRRQEKNTRGKPFDFQRTGVTASFSLEWRRSLRIPDLSCPACAAVGSLAVDFVDGQACPGCRLGTLQCDSPARSP